MSNLKESILNTMWGEHASYKSTRHHLSNLHTEGKYVIQGPGENAGLIDAGGGLVVALRIESHNHPTFLDPVEGAATGVGGIIRDIFTMNAYPIALLDMRRIGTDQRAKEILDGSTKGISNYGNCVGVPVVGGDLYFDSTYNRNPLVNVTCVGIGERKNIVYGNALTEGNDLIYVGARTGLEGVGGSNMASSSLTGSEDAATVQKGDPLLERLLIEASLDVAREGWIEGQQDLGAAGILCSTTELPQRGSKRTGLPLGAKIYLDRVPTRTGLRMTPEEILLSETQERMMMVGKREHRDKILERIKHWGLEASVIGKITMDGNYTVVYSEDGQEKQETLSLREICEPIRQDWPLEEWKTQGTPHKKASPATIQEIWRQYDWRVGIRTIKGPNQPGKYAILNLRETGKELVLAWSSDEGLSDIDPAMGIDHAFMKAYERMKSLGVEPRGLTNCLNFGHPKDSMGAFAQTTETLAKLCERYEVPVVSGNVSLYNSSRNPITKEDISIKPTPILVMVGIR